MAKVLSSGRAVSKFKLQPRWYVHIQTNTLVKGRCSLYPTRTYGLNSISAVLHQCKLNNPRNEQRNQMIFKIYEDH